MLEKKYCSVHMTRFQHTGEKLHTGELEVKWQNVTTGGPEEVKREKPENNNREGKKTKEGSEKEKKEEQMSAKAAML